MIGLVGLLGCGDEEIKVQRYKSQQGTPGQIVEMNILSAQDYHALTGCGGGIAYVDAMTSGLRYLMFESPEEEQFEWGYRQRHIRPLLRSISDEEGRIESDCLPPSVRFVGESMGLLGPAEDNPEFVYHPSKDGFPKEVGSTLRVQSRKAYMDETGCLLSPQSWENYILAVYAYLDVAMLGSDRLARPLNALFEDLSASRPGSDGGFDDRCWTEGLRKMDSASHPG